MSTQFQELHTAMGVTEFLTSIELDWEPLRVRGIDVAITEVDVWDDQTLVYDGKRIVVYIRDQHAKYREQGRGYKYHLADCKTLQNMRRQKRYERYVATNRSDGFFLVNVIDDFNDTFEEDIQDELQVCWNCLDTLNWERFQRIDRAQKTKIRDDFDLAYFFETYGSEVSVVPQHNEYSAPQNKYTADWGEIKDRLRQEAGWKCESCQITLSDKSAKRFLHVHHINGNRSHNSRVNLQVLCIGCHAKEPQHQRLKNSPDYEAYMIWKRTR
jgi:hypothetical protein